MSFPAMIWNANPSRKKRKKAKRKNPENKGLAKKEVASLKKEMAKIMGSVSTGHKKHKRKKTMAKKRKKASRKHTKRAKKHVVRHKRRKRSVKRHSARKHKGGFVKVSSNKIYKPVKRRRHAKRGIEINPLKLMKKISVKGLSGSVIELVKNGAVVGIGFVGMDMINSYGLSKIPVVNTNVYAKLGAKVVSTILVGVLMNKVKPLAKLSKGVVMGMSANIMLGVYNEMVAPALKLPSTSQLSLAPSPVATASTGTQGKMLNAMVGSSKMIGSGSPSFIKRKSAF